MKFITKKAEGQGLYIEYTSNYNTLTEIVSPTDLKYLLENIKGLEKDINEYLKKNG